MPVSATVPESSFPLPHVGGSHDGGQHEEASSRDPGAPPSPSAAVADSQEHMLLLRLKGADLTRVRAYLDGR